jgi:serine/threonine protein kinase
MVVVTYLLSNTETCQRIRREVLVWQRLTHENVLPLLGTVSHFGRYMSLVSPWMDNGSLMQYLQECGDNMSLMRRLQLVSLSRCTEFFSHD